MEISKKYLPIKPTRNENNIRISVFYDLGGHSYFTGQNSERGYYVSVQPVCVDDRNGYQLVTETMFRGYKYLLLPVKRQSKKAELQAIELAKDIKWLIDKVCNEYGLELLGD